MSYRKFKKNVTRNLTELEKKLKAAVNNQPLRKRIIYALRIIGGRW